MDLCRSCVARSPRSIHVPALAIQRWGDCDWSALTEVSRVNANRERPKEKAITA